MRQVIQQGPSWDDTWIIRLVTYSMWRTRLWLSNERMINLKKNSMLFIILKTFSGGSGVRIAFSSSFVSFLQTRRVSVIPIIYMFIQTVIHFSMQNAKPIGNVRMLVLVSKCGEEAIFNIYGQNGLKILVLVIKNQSKNINLIKWKK